MLSGLFRRLLIILGRGDREVFELPITVQKIDGKLVLVVEGRVSSAECKKLQQMWGNGWRPRNWPDGAA